MRLQSASPPRRSPWPWVFLPPMIGLAVLGLLNLSSAGGLLEGGGQEVWRRQIIWMALGLVQFVVLSFMGQRTLSRLAVPVYALVLILLLVVLFKGTSAMGARRWIDFGIFRAQPSEAAKIAVILMLSAYFQKFWSPRGYGGLDILPPLAIILAPMMLVLVQPDLGTSGVIALIGTVLLLFAKIRWRTLAFLVITGLLAMAVGYKFVLKPYQKKRIETFLDPEKDPRGSGYHIIQSKIAIGSGGLTGKGRGQGTQSQLRFLPEQHTDFAFAVFAEEWGFAGVMIVLGLFLWILLFGLVTAAEAPDIFGTMLAVGICGYFTLSVITNLAMITGLIPVVGVPLPFFSYGGSAMFTNMGALGLLASVHRGRGEG